MPPEHKAAGSTPATVTTTRNPLPRLSPFLGCSSPFQAANKPVLYVQAGPLARQADSIPFSVAVV